MMSSIRLCGVAASLLFSFLASKAIAQNDVVGVSGISVNSSDRLPLKPERMRLVMWISAQSTDAKSAVQVLAEHKDRVKQELADLKADMTSLAFSTTRVTANDAEQDPQGIMRMQVQMQRQLLRAQGRAAPDVPKSPPLMKATCALKVEWNVSELDAVGLALLPATLKAQLNSLDFAGEKNKPAQNGREEADSEVIAQSTAETGPQVTFVASISDDQIKQATQAAYQSAVKEAELISASTGVKLGKLLGLSSSIAETPSYITSRIYNQTPSPALLFSETRKIVSSSSIDELVLTVTVRVLFGIN